MNWITTAFKRAFDYSGRSRRMEYWAYALFAFVLSNVISAILQVLERNSEDSGANPIVGLLGTLAMLGLCIPGLAVSVRRLHDANFAGWWVALPFAPVLGWALVLVGQFNGESLFGFFMVAIIVAPLILLALMCLPGTQGPNRFGADPKAPGLGETFR